MNNKGLKELLAKIEGQLNYKEEWEADKVQYTYKLKLTEDGKIQCYIMDDDYIDYTIEVKKSDSVTHILKEFINCLYEEEINRRQAYLKANKAYFKSKHKSLALWLDRDKKDKVITIVEDIAERYKESKRLEFEVKHYKGFIAQFYSCLNELEPYWRVKEVKDSISEKVKKLSIKNVDISSREDRITIVKSDDAAENVVDKFQVVIGSHVNKNAIANQVIARLNIDKVA